MGNNKIISILFLALVPFLTKAQDNDWPRFELYQLVQGQDSGIFVITDSDSNLVFTDLLKMRFFPDTALIFNGDTIAVKPDIPSFVEGLGISIEYDPVLNQYTFESLSIEDSIHNGTASLITKGTPLYAAGVQGNYWSVAPADAGNSAKMPVVIIAGEDIAAGENGLGLIKGHIKQVNTTGLASGAEVYVAVGGGYTATKPKGENAIVQRLGTVIKGNSTNGSGIINLGDPRTTSNLNPDKIFIGGADSTVTTINLKTTITDSLNNRLSNYIATGATSGAGISGSATGPASTFTVTSNATTLNTPNTIVYRDGSGNFKAGVIEGNLAGIAREVQSALTPGYGITPSDTYNGSIARTFNVDTTTIAYKTWVTAQIGSGGVTGTFTNGSVPYAATSGSALTNSGWYINSGNLMDRVATPSYKLDVNGSIGGTTLTASGRINADSILVTKGATFNTQQGSFNFRVDGNLETGLIFANATTNRVGIGLTGNPNYKLDVNGDVNISSGSVYRINGTPITGSQWTTTGSDIYYNSGRVGIGMTLPTSTLHVTGDIRGTDDLNIDNGTFFVDASENAVGVGTSSPQFPLDVVGSARIDGSTFFVSSSNDRVGIGTGTPGYKLDVVGDVNISSGSNFRIGGTAIGTTTINNNANNRIITGSGTANTLEAEANLTWDGSTIFQLTGTAGAGRLLVNSFEMSTVSNNAYLINRAGGDFYLNADTLVNNITLKSNGNVDITDLGTDPVYSNNGVLTNTNPSDKRLKQNINNFKYGLNEINKLNPVSFQYKDSKDNSIKFGYIAQEVKEIIPEAVETQKDGYLGMYPDKIDVVAVKAIQELYQMVINQQTQIEELKSEVKQLKKKRKQN